MNLPVTSDDTMIKRSTCNFYVLIPTGLTYLDADFALVDAAGY